MHIDSGNMILFKSAKIDSKKMDDKEMVDSFKKFADYGRANQKNISEKDVDQKQLEMGIEVEKEHTTDKEIAKRIALDHLAEISDYYTRLKKMEEEGKKKE